MSIKLKDEKKKNKISACKYGALNINREKAINIISIADW
jgi:hypothetical protein